MTGRAVPAIFKASCALALPVALIAFLYAGFYRSQYLEAAFPKARASVDGAVVDDAAFVGGKLHSNRLVRHWGSWVGPDEKIGEMRLGPFRAPKILHFAIGGYPRTPGIRVFLELADGSEQSAITPPDIGEHWKLRQHVVPPAWRGRPIFLHMIDSATSPGGRIGISEPIRGDLWTDSAELLESLACWVLNGFLLGCIFLSASHWLAKTNLPNEWIALLAGAIVALLGYALFWIFFWNANLGKIATGAILGAGVVGAWRSVFLKGESASPWPTGRLLVWIGFLYIAILYLFAAPFDFYGLAANRFNEGLPPDNYLPYLVAKSLSLGNSLRTPMGGWLVSDRPPLQTGWLLFTYPFAGLLGFDERALTGTSALWFQSLWITAAYGLTRALRLTRFRACSWIAVMAMSGFFLQNTTFTWPKLAAGSFACGAFAFWCLPMRSNRSVIHFAIGGGLAAVAWLTHGGVAFAFIPLVLWALWRISRGEWKGWLCATAVFVIVVAPWFCFQKFYNPPANRLLKWHLAGQVEIDPRGTFETLRDSYGGQSLSGLASAKLLNFKTQFAGDWRSLFDFGQGGAKDRRLAEFFYSARTLTWWWLWVLIFPLLLLRGWRPRFSSPSAVRLALASWIVSTVTVWCLLIFIGGQAIIHQGSYTIELAAFALFSALLEAVNKWALALVALLQGATLATTWIVPNAEVNGKMIGLPLLVLAVFGVAAVLLREATREKSESSNPATTSVGRI